MRTQFIHYTEASPKTREQLDIANSLLEALVNNRIISEGEKAKYIEGYNALAPDATDWVKQLTIKIGAEFSLSERLVNTKNFSFLVNNQGATRTELSIFRYLQDKKFWMEQQIFDVDYYAKPNKFDFCKKVIDHIHEIGFNFQRLLKELETELQSATNQQHTELGKSNYSHLRRVNHAEIIKSTNDFLKKLIKLEEYFVAEHFLAAPRDVQSKQVAELRLIDPRSKELDLHGFVCYLHSEDLRNNYYHEHGHYQLPLKNIADYAIHFKFEPAYTLLFNQYITLAKTDNQAFSLLRQLYKSIPQGELRQNHVDRAFDAKVADSCRMQFDELKLFKIREIKKYIDNKLAAGGDKPWDLGWFGNRFGTLYTIPYNGKNVRVPKGMHEIYQWVKDDTLLKAAPGSKEQKDALTQIEEILASKSPSNCFANAFYTVFGCARSSETQAAYDEIAEKIGCKT